MPKKFVDKDGFNHFIGIIKSFFASKSYVGEQITKKASKVWQGTCSTAETTAAKEVNVEDGFELKDGVKVRVYFDVRNNVADPTLNVNGTGAAEIYYNNMTSAGVDAWKAQTYLDLTYVLWDNGFGQTYPTWIIDNYSLGDQYVKGIVSLSDTPSSRVDASKGVAATPKAVQAVKEIADAALPKTGGNLDGYLNIAPSTLPAIIDILKGANDVYFEATDTNALGALTTSNTDIQLNAGANTSYIYINGKTAARLQLNASDFGSTKLTIGQNQTRAFIQGLTAPVNSTDATNKAYVDSKVSPVGAMVLFDPSYVPEGWVLCDGNNGTSDLTAHGVGGMVWIQKI